MFTQAALFDLSLHKGFCLLSLLFNNDSAGKRYVTFFAREPENTVQPCFAGCLFHFQELCFGFSCDKWETEDTGAGCDACNGCRCSPRIVMREGFQLFPHTYKWK